MDNVIAILNQDIGFQEKLKNICLELYNEEVNVYREENGEFITYEVHFNDDNYYEIDYSVNSFIDLILVQIQNNILNERELDLKSESANINRNNIRYFNKYLI